MSAFGVNVPRMITLTFVFGAMLAAFAGVLAAPIYRVSSIMGSNLIIGFAVVVIGGMGSIMGSIVTAFVVGLIEGLTKVFFPRRRTRDLRDHGDRAADPPRRVCSAERVTCLAHLTENVSPKPLSRPRHPRAMRERVRADGRRCSWSRRSSSIRCS